MAKSEKYCPNCGAVAVPKRYMRGSFIVELALWLLFILPGIIYSVYRLASKSQVCPECGASNMIPLDSPVARAAAPALPHGDAR